ncbi:hypothetical protein RB595_008932 [Gaeumannomyces hyphopodioides]
MATITTLERVSAAKLRDLMLAPGADNTEPAVVDVRDDDYIGGHIKGSLNHPSRTLDTTMPSLVRRLQDKPTVVFHCALSKQRGPDAALMYIREREALLAKSKEPAAAGAGNKEEAADPGDEKEAAPVVQQKVYVLDRGFVGWQEAYGEDETLTEGYRKELWKDGYWG